MSGQDRRAARLSGLVATIGVLWLATAPTAAFEGTATLPLPAGHSPSEAHLAVNPLDPANVAVVSKDLTSDAQAVRYWYTTDGGASWGGGPFIDGAFEGRSADGSDPVAAFGPTGTAYYGALVFRYATHSWQSLIVVGRSTDDGSSYPAYGVTVRTRHGPPVPEPGYVEGGQSWHDKEWMAVDQSSGPYRGRLYVAWDRIKDQGSDLLFARSTDGGHTFSAPRRIERQASDSQVVVGPTGRVHLVWNRQTNAGTTLRHASSSNGGRTFSAPRTVADIEGADEQLAPAIPTLVVSPSGRLLACWAEAAGSDGARTVCTRSATGAHWSKPVAVTPAISGSTRQWLPAAAAQGERFWVAAYVAGSSRTRVVLYSSTNGGASFTQAQTLAQRDYGKNAIGAVGDYMGLAATTDHVLAAYALGQDDPNADQRVYVTSVAAP